MLRKLSNTLVLNKNLLRNLGNRFSSTPEPNQNNQLPQKQPDIDPPSVDPPQKPQKEDVKNIRSEARIFVCRSQLNKYAKAEVDYEKLNIPTKQMQKVQKGLQYYGIKIRNIIEGGPLIQFHRAQEIFKKPQQRQQKSQKQQSESQDTVPEQQEDVKLQFKIYTRPFKQLSTIQSEEFEKFFATPQDLLSQMNGQIQKSTKGSNIFAPPKKRSGSLSNSSFKEYKNIYSLIGDLYSHGLEIFNLKNEQKDQFLQRFKEFTLYMRDARKKGSKWVKYELVVENWQAVHFYRINLVDNAEQDAKNGKKQVNKYLGPQAKQLDKQLLELLKLSFQSVQEIDPISFLPIYYYTGLREQQHYRKWLDDLVDLTK